MEFNAIKTRKENEKKKKKVKPIHDKVNSVYPVVGATKEGYIKMSFFGETIYACILDSKKHDLYYLNDEDYSEVAGAYQNVQRGYLNSYKEIYMMYPEENQEQQEYFSYKMEHTTNQYQLDKLEVEFDKLQRIEKNYSIMSSYSMIFGKSIEELEENIDKIVSLGGKLLGFKPVTLIQSAKILNLMNNTRSALPYLKEFPEDKDRDSYFVELTQPVGGISFKNEAFNRHADKYSACIHIISKPTRFSNFWMYDLASIENTTTVFDNGFDDTVNYNKDTSDSIEELITMFNRAQTQAERDDLQEEITILRDLNSNISRAGEKIKTVFARQYVSGTTQAELEEKVRDVMSRLSDKGYVGRVGLNEQKEEYQSMFLPYEYQLQLRNKRQGMEFPSELLGIGIGFNQTSLSDPCGRYFGVTRTDGLVYFDMWHKTENRLSYNIFISGTMGSGKSTIQKAILDDNWCKGYMIRGFAVNGEYDKIIEFRKGKKIALDGTQGTLNIMQVYPTIYKKINDEEVVDVDLSFSSHLNMLSLKFKLYKPQLTDSQLETLMTTASEFYEFIGLWGNPDVVITDLENKQYPVLSDFLDYVNKKIEEEKEDYIRNQLHELQGSIKSMVTTYPSILNRHSNMVNTANDQLVFYDLENLISMKDNIFDLQFFSALSLIQSDLLKVGREEKRAYDNHLKPFWAIKRSVLINDECHNTLNINKPDAVEMISTYMSEGRKSFIGYVNATQMIERMFPKLSNVSDKGIARAVDKLKEIVGLSQYKIFMKQSDTSLSSIRKIFEDTFSDDELSQMPYMKANKEHGSDGILSILGEPNLHIRFQFTQQELEIFDGGA